MLGLGIPIAFVLEKYQKKYLLSFKICKELNEKILNKENEILENFKNTEVQKEILLELHEVAQLMKVEKNNLNFENHFLRLVEMLSKGDYEAFKDDILQNFKH